MRQRVIGDTERGIVVCHNGDVYVYEVGDKPFSQRLFDETVEKYRKSGYNKGIEANIKALEQFEMDYGIKWRKYNEQEILRWSGARYGTNS